MGTSDETVQNDLTKMRQMQPSSKKNKKSDEEDGWKKVEPKSPTKSAQDKKKKKRNKGITMMRIPGIDRSRSKQLFNTEGSVAYRTRSKGKVSVRETEQSIERKQSTNPQTPPKKI